VVIGLIPWVVYLGHSLPPRFDVHDWGVVWIGFDAVLIVVLASTAWAFWFRRQILVSTAIVAGTLLSCDAWFDVVTSIGSPGAWVSLVIAVGGEIPLALFFFRVAYRLLARTVAAFHAAMGRPGPPPKIRDAVVLVAPADPPRREPPGRPRARRPAPRAEWTGPAPVRCRPSDVRGPNPHRMGPAVGGRRRKPAQWPAIGPGLWRAKRYKWRSGP